MSETVSILVADIGGTHSRFASFALDEGLSLAGESVWFKTASVSSFESLVRRYLEQRPVSARSDSEVFVIAAAGPVTDGVYCNPPNINWDIDLRNTEALSEFHSVVLINDFVAQACASISPVADSFSCVHPGAHSDTENKVVLGVGTGLGVASMQYIHGSGLEPFASEAGHCSMAFESEEEHAFQSFLLEESSSQYIECEDILSGAGLERVHQYLYKESRTAEEIASQWERSPLTMQWFARFLGRVCRNLVISYVARGGVYLSGGVLIKNPQIVAHEAFLSAYHRSTLPALELSSVPVFLMQDEDCGLWGAAAYGKRFLERSRERS